MRNRKNNKLNLNRILDSASSSKEDLLFLADKLRLSPTITWQKDYDPVNDANGQIINLGDPLFKSGTHWVCTYGDQYFDSFGLPPPPMIKNKKYSDIQIQRSSAGKCGLYCMLWMRYAKDGNVKEFYDKFG